MTNEHETPAFPRQELSETGEQIGIELDADARYWFGLFSHQRATSLWKGMLRVDLESDDVLALELLGEVT